MDPLVCLVSLQIGFTLTKGEFSYCVNLSVSRTQLIQNVCRQARADQHHSDNCHLNSSGGGSSFVLSQLNAYFSYPTVVNHTASFSTWPKLSGAAPKVSAKEGPKCYSILQQVLLLAVVGVRTVHVLPVNPCQISSGFVYHTLSPCWQSAAKEHNKQQYACPQTPAWQLDFNSKLVCHWSKETTGIQFTHNDGNLLLHWNRLPCIPWHHRPEESTSY